MISFQQCLKMLLNSEQVIFQVEIPENYFSQEITKF